MEEYGDVWRDYQMQCQSMTDTLHMMRVRKNMERWWIMNMHCAAKLSQKTVMEPLRPPGFNGTSLPSASCKCAFKIKLERCYQQPWKHLTSETVSSPTTWTVNCTTSSARWRSWGPIIILQFTQPWWMRLFRLNLVLNMHLKVLRRLPPPRCNVKHAANAIASFPGQDPSIRTIWFQAKLRLYMWDWATFFICKLELYFNFSGTTSHQFELRGWPRCFRCQTQLRVWKVGPADTIACSHFKAICCGNLQLGNDPLPSLFPILRVLTGSDSSRIQQLDVNVWHVLPHAQEVRRTKLKLTLQNRSLAGCLNRPVELQTICQSPHAAWSFTSSFAQGLALTWEKGCAGCARCACFAKCFVFALTLVHSW